MGECVCECAPVRLCLIQGCGALSSLFQMLMDSKVIWMRVLMWEGLIVLSGFGVWMRRDWEHDVAEGTV